MEETSDSKAKCPSGSSERFTHPLGSIWLAPSFPEARMGDEKQDRLPSPGAPGPPPPNPARERRLPTNPAFHSLQGIPEAPSLPLALEQLSPQPPPPTPTPLAPTPQRPCPALSWSHRMRPQGESSPMPQRATLGHPSCRSSPSARGCRQTSDTLIFRGPRRR